MWNTSRFVTGDEIALFTCNYISSHENRWLKPSRAANARRRTGTRKMSSHPCVGRKAIPQPALKLRSSRYEWALTSVRQKIRMVVFAIVLPLSGPSSASAQAQVNPSPAETCLAANPNISLGVRLPLTEAKLKSGSPLKIVAIGSSSTVGLWVLTEAATY